MKRSIPTLMGLFVYAMSGIALAGHCPLDAKAIEHALESSDMSAAKKQEIMQLKDKGMDLHRAGDHRESERVLAEAMRKTLMAQ